MLRKKGYRNDEEDVLGLPDGHPSHSRHLLQPKLGHDLSSLNSEFQQHFTQTQCQTAH